MWPGWLAGWTGAQRRRPARDAPEMDWNDGDITLPCRLFFLHAHRRVLELEECVR
jgi:hypothetical protein